MRMFTVLSACLLVLSLSSHGHAQRDFSGVEISSEQLAEGIYILRGAGGNIGLSVGEDGAFIVDDQFAPLTDKIQAAIAEITDQPVRFVINTHWHGDHTGGNENFAESGSVVIAHDNVRKRMASEHVNEFFGRTTPPSPDRALPVITFNDTTTLHLNGESVRVIHMPHGHTDGDSIVWFPDSEVVHMGDNYFNGMYPFIDLSSNGGIDGMIRASAEVLDMIGPNTRVIPGHGPLASRADLKDYHDSLVMSRDAIQALMKDGKSLTDIQSAKPTAELTEKWGADGFIKPDQFVEFVYRSLEAAAQPHAIQNPAGQESDTAAGESS